MDIKNPQWLEIESNGQTIYGLNQEWFSSFVKRTAGCGPTVASTLLIYLNKRDGGPLPYQNNDISAATQAMEDVWRFVTPGPFGLDSTEKFVKGVKKLLHHYGTSWSCHELSVKKHEPIEKIASFIESGIASDCPVAFLNLHSGELRDLEGWHWIALTSLRSCNGRHTAAGYDDSQKIEFDLSQWVKTTKMGGGFVYLN